MWKLVKATALALGLWATMVGSHAQTCGLRDNGDGTMTDPNTSITIQKCNVGRRWNGTDCGTERHTDFKWEDAVARYGTGLWRMISVEEARMVVSRSKGCKIDGGWTSSDGGDGRHAWGVSFGSGDVGLSDRRFTAPILLVRASQSSGSTSASSSNAQRPTPAQNTQQAAAQQQPAQNRQPNRDRPDLMGHGCDVGQGSTVQNGCPQTIHYVMCIVRHPDGRTTGADTCRGGQFLSGSLSPQESRRVVDGNADYLVAACKNPARPYNFRYVPSSQGISTFCGQ